MSPLTQAEIAALHEALDDEYKAWTTYDQVARFLRHRGEATEPPARAPPRDPPYFKSLVVRRRPSAESSPHHRGELFEEH